MSMADFSSSILECRSGWREKKVGKSVRTQTSINPSTSFTIFFNPSEMFFPLFFATLISRFQSQSLVELIEYITHIVKNCAALHSSNGIIFPCAYLPEQFNERNEKSIKKCGREAKCSPWLLHALIGGNIKKTLKMTQLIEMENPKKRVQLCNLEKTTATDDLINYECWGDHVAFPNWFDGFSLSRWRPVRCWCGSWSGKRWNVQTCDFDWTDNERVAF